LPHIEQSTRHARAGFAIDWKPNKPSECLGFWNKSANFRGL
jgi:hypothetical protein